MKFFKSDFEPENFSSIFKSVTTDECSPAEFRQRLANAYEELPTKSKEEIYNYFIGRSYNENSIQYDLSSDSWIKETMEVIRQRFPKKEIFLLSDYMNTLPNTKKIKPQQIEKNSDESVYLCVYKNWKKCENAIKIIKKNKSYYYLPMRGFPPARYFQMDDELQNLFRQEADIKESHFDSYDFENIAQVIEFVTDIEGDFVEIGTFRGRSAHFMLSYQKLKNHKRNCYFLDTFEGFSYDSAQNSSDAGWYKTHQETSMEEVDKFLSEFENYKLIKIDITKDPFPIDKKIAFCNIDVDMEEAVYSALQKVASLISWGGVILCEDYGHLPRLAGAKIAVDSFLKSEQGKNFKSIYLSSGQMLLLKIKME